MNAIKRSLRESRYGPLMLHVHQWLARRKPSTVGAVSDHYDDETVEVMRRVLKADSAAVDIGAHEGKILHEIVRLAPLGKHIAVEALPHLARYLQWRFPGVEVVQAAASDRRGKAEFNYVEDDPAYSGLERRGYDRADPQIRLIEVDLVRLDDIIPADRQVAFLKLDIEGGEYHALRGATATIQRGRPVIVFEAGSGSSGHYGVGPEQVLDLVVGEFGYHLSTMARWLAGQPPYTRDEFLTNWEHGPDWYFLAYPAAK